MIKTLWNVRFSMASSKTDSPVVALHSYTWTLNKQSHAGVSSCCPCRAVDRRGNISICCI